MSAVSVTVSTIPDRGIRAGPSPGTALQSIRVRPIPFVIARKIIVQHHYLHSLPGGTKLAFGVFQNGSLFGAVTFGAGPQNAFSLVGGASAGDCLTLTRLWLSDELPSNSESRLIGIALKAIKRFTYVKFIVTYADPSAGHVGTIYQSTNWLYTGLSEVMPLYDLGDGKLRHSRTLSASFGSHSLKHFESHGITLRAIDQPAKHRYIYFLDPTWRSRLETAVLPYPKKGVNE